MPLIVTQNTEQQKEKLMMKKYEKMEAERVS
jgi:hypothetical protein